MQKRYFLEPKMLNICLVIARSPELFSLFIDRIPIFMYLFILPITQNLAERLKFITRKTTTAVIGVDI